MCLLDRSENEKSLVQVPYGTWGALLKSTRYHALGFPFPLELKLQTQATILELKP